MNILKSGGTLFLAYEGRMGRANITPWHYIPVETLWWSTCIKRYVPCILSGLTLNDTIFAPGHSPLSGCTLQVSAGPGWPGWHWVDSSLTRECLPLTIFRTGAGVNQSGPEYSGPSNGSTEARADNQLEIVTAWQQPDEQFRFERNFPYS